MTVNTTKDQIECKFIINRLGCKDALQPSPGEESCVSIIPIPPVAFIIIENDPAGYTIHLLTQATESEAWEFYDSLFKDGCRNERLSFISKPDAKLN